MASPFSVFRKHQKVMLATVCLLAMISFVFLPIVGQTARSLTSGASNPVVVSSRYGDLRESDFHQLRNQYYTVVNFMTRALEAVGYKSDPQWAASMMQYAGRFLSSLPPEQIQQLLQQEWIGQLQGRIQREFGPPTERNMADTWLLSQRARELGILVSDQAVIDYIRVRTAESLPEDKAAAIIESIGVSQPQLLEAFRNELLAQRLRQIFVVSLGGTTPAQRWEAFQRLRRQATVELATLNVADFVAKVPQPDEKTIGEFFDRYKTKPANPDSPEPGFREPYRATVEYFRADFEKFVDPKSVTDEEIAKYYDQHKEEFVKQELPKPDEPAAAKPAEKRKAEAPKIELPKVEAPKIEPPRQKPAPKAPEKSSDKPTDSGKKSSLWKSTRLSLVALEAKPKAAPKPDVKSAAAAKTEVKAEPKPAVKLEPKPEVKSAAPAKTEAKPESQPAAKGQPKPDTNPVAKLQPKPASTPAAKPEPKPQYQPLEQVRDQIRNRLARDKAAKKMGAMLEPIRDQLRRYSAQLARAIGRKETELPKFDAAGVAKANGLTLHRLQMVSERDVAGRDIAGSRVTGDQQTFEKHVFGVPGLGRPAVSRDLELNMYLFWKVEERKEHVPELDEPGVRQRVIEVWRMVQARGLATTEADRLAAKARKSKAPLKDSLKQEPNVKIFDPKPFSWLTEGSVPRGMPEQGPPQYSQVEGAMGAGAEFMQAVFDLAQGGVGVAANHPKTEVYVVRADQFSPSTEVLWAVFIHEDYSRYASAAFEEQKALFLSWVDEIKHSAAFEWKREADRRDESAEPYRAPEPIEAPQF